MNMTNFICNIDVLMTFRYKGDWCYSKCLSKSTNLYLLGGNYVLKVLKNFEDFNCTLDTQR